MSFFTLVARRIASLPAAHRFHEKAAALIVKIKARRDAYLCNAANEEDVELLEFLAVDDQEASSRQSNGDGAEFADEEDQEVKIEAAREVDRGLYCIHEGPSPSDGGPSLLDLSCSHPKTHSTQHTLPSLPTTVINLGANFLRPFSERYPEAMAAKDPRYFTRTCTLGKAWACEMLCWRRALLVARQQEELGLLGIYRNFGHSEIFGLTQPETVNKPDYSAAVKKVLEAWDIARKECGFD
jgi:hypothetical protein